VNIRFAIEADIPDIVVLGRQSSTAAPWSRPQYEQLFQPGAGAPPRLAWLAEADAEAGPTIVGFLVARFVAPEWELENIVVAPSARRKGIGKLLLGALLVRARATKSQSVFLEVRESNTAARSLYATAGLRQNGRRKAYYGDPPEAAILCRLDLH